MSKCDHCKEEKELESGTSVCPECWKKWVEKQPKIRDRDTR